MSPFDICALLVRVMRLAARDHGGGGTDPIVALHASVLESRKWEIEDGMPSGLSLAELFRAFRADEADYRDYSHVLPACMVKVERVELFPEIDRWGCCGAVEVTYSRKGWRAVYGFTPEGKLSLWAN